MNRNRSPWLLLWAILWLAGVPGCAVTNPSLNSFQARISYEKKTLPRTGIPLTISGGKKVCILIHGIYGNADTFGRLADTLLKDQELAADSVYVMEYWSSRMFPNFQRLADLGNAFAKHLEAIASSESDSEVVVIAHSQGGLIAKSAILSMKDKGETAILDRMKLIMIGTPNYASLYATYNNLFVNSAFAGVTYGLSLATFGLAPPLVYNRQAYDMANTRLDLVEGNDDLSPFMENMILRWGETFPTGVNGSPKGYAIIGVKNLFDHYSLSDGVVHALTSLFAGVPAKRVHYVPYRHFGEEAAIGDDSHRTYKAIKAILMEGNDPVPSEQRLSPFPSFSISLAMFVKGVKTQALMMVEQVRLNDEPRKPFTIESAKQTVQRRIGSDAGGALLKQLLQLGLLPFQFLQSLVEPPVALWDHRHDPQPRWEVLTLPTVLLSGEYEGAIEISRTPKSSSWFFGLGGREKVAVPFIITISDVVDDVGSQCQVKYPVEWKSTSENDNSKKPEGPPRTQKLKISPNSVNFIHVETQKDEETQRDMVILSAGSCIRHN